MAKEKEYTNSPKMGEVEKNQLDSTGTFLIVNVEDKWRIGMAGRWMTKELFATPEDAEKYIQSKPWELIMNLAGVVAEYLYTVKNNPEK